MTRPTSVTVVAVIILAFNLLGLAGLLFSGVASSDPEIQAIMEAQMADAPFSYGVIQAVGYVTMVINIACAIGMFKGADWSRKVYVGMGVLGIIFNAMTVTDANPFGWAGVGFGVVILGLFAFLLYRQPADNYFKGIEDEEDDWDDEA